MRFTKLMLIMLLMTLSSQMTYAATAAVATHSAVDPNAEVASTVMKVQAMRINNTLTHDGKTEIFMDLQNTGKSTHTLTAAYCPLAKQVQLHETINHGKQTQMEQITAISVPPHKDQDLHFGGLHVMLIGLSDPLETHEEVPVTLIFSDGSWLTVDASVFTAPNT